MDEANKPRGKVFCVFRYLYNRYIRKNSPGSLPIILSLLVKSKATVVDIGANVGDWVRAVNKFAPWRQRFICFEANPNLTLPIDLSSETIQWEPLALGSKPSMMDLVVPANDRLGYLVSDTDISNQQKESRVRVKVGVLDDLMLHKSDNVFLKIDVEGAEKLVLEGGRNFLKRTRPAIFIETFDEFAQRHKSSSKEVLTILEKLNYEIYWINTQDRLSRIVPSVLGEIPGVFNKYIDFLAIPKEDKSANLLARLIIG